MTFSQLKTFLEVARQGSVRGAAASLLITEPSVSAALAALRDELEVALVAPGLAQHDGHEDQVGCRVR